MLTLTYRENQTDRALCKVHFKEWVRRMKRALGEFRFCASFEVQERGAMHVHCVTHKMPTLALYRGVKVKTWQLGTRIWREVVGADNGLCFVGADKSKWGAARRHKLSLAKMANYVSKYILKDFEDAPSESNRYSRSNGQVLADVHVARFNGSLADIVGACFECNDGDVIVSHRVGYFKDSWWLCTERGAGPLDS
jgi:hypothetical protein